MRILKRILLASTICFLLTLLADAQCVTTTADPCVAVNQSILDRASAAVTELRESRIVIEKFKNQTLLSDAERAAADRLVKSLNEVLDVRGRIILEYERMQTIYQKVIDMQSAVIDRLTKELNKPKSAWQKFVAVLKTIATVAFGIAIGRGGL